MSIVHHDRGESPLKQMTSPAAARIDEVGVTSMRLADGATQADLVAWDCDEVDVIGHQTIGPNHDAGLQRLLSQQIAIDLVVAVFEKDRFAPVSALRDVVRIIGDNDAAEPDHAWMLDAGERATNAIVVELRRGCSASDKLRGMGIVSPDSGIRIQGFSVFCKARKKICSAGTRFAKGAGAFISALDGIAILGGAVTFEGIGGVLFVAGCVNPTPFEPASCALGVSALVLITPGAFAVGYEGAQVFNMEVIP